MKDHIKKTIKDVTKIYEKYVEEEVHAQLKKLVARKVQEAFRDPPLELEKAIGELLADCVKMPLTKKEITRIQQEMRAAFIYRASAMAQECGDELAIERVDEIREQLEKGWRNE